MACDKIDENQFPYLGALSCKHSGVYPLGDDDKSPLGSLFVFGAADGAHRLTDLLDLVFLDRVNLACFITEFRG